MSEILVRPQQLRLTAQTLRQKARTVRTALETVDRILKELTPVKFEGSRASSLRSRYTRARAKIFEAPGLIETFAKELETTAQVFEKADQATNAGGDSKAPIPIPLPTPSKPQPVTPNPTASNIPPVVQNSGSSYSNWKVSGGTYPTYGSGKLHPGIDIVPKTPGDTGISPIGPGIIKKIGQDILIDPKTKLPVLDENGNPKLTGYGNYLVVEHTLLDGSKVYSRYAHLANPTDLQVGAKVDPTSNIGTMGSTGNSTGPHLHFSLQNDYPASESFYGHKPDELVNPSDPNSGTWLQVMENNFIDPESILKSDFQMQFQNI
jgi:murein DD-endopeptidase MepM/ murein hydrolase activator NlpD